jgi:hypothetical protein
MAREHYSNDADVAALTIQEAFEEEETASYATAKAREE